MIFLPKFSEYEMEIIRAKLCSEGEKLFTAFGIKKVTIDDLVKAAGIAKGSFYRFYVNKEHLFMDINEKIQILMWKDLDGILEKNKTLPPRELTKTVFNTMSAYAARYPIITQLTADTLEHLIRKLPPEVVEEHTQMDSNELEKLEAFGVRFTCGRDLAAKVLQHVFLCSVNLKGEDAATQQAIMEVLINGAIDQIVEDEK